MGKSEGNMIKMNDKPEEIYGKVMAFNDDMILNGFEILTSASMQEIKEYKKRLDSKENPMILKKELAFKITSEITSERAAKQAQEFFESVFQNKDKDIEIPVKEVTEKEIPLNQLLVNIGFASSKLEAKRLTELGAVKIAGKKITKYNYPVDTSSKPEVRVGRKLCKITFRA